MGNRWEVYLDIYLPKITETKLGFEKLIEK